MHQIEPLVDLVQWQCMGNHRINLDLALHVPVNDLWYIGTAARATKRGTAPAAPGHQLEGPGIDFLSGTGNTDDDGFAPTLVTAFQRLAHHIGIADTFKGIIRAAASQLDQMPDKIITMIRRIDKMGHAETLAPFLFAVVQIDTDNLVGPIMRSP